MTQRKSPPRVHVPGTIAAHGVCVLPPEQSHHLSHVLRLAVGDAVTAFDGRGSEYSATIAKIAKHGATLTLGEPREVSRESPLRVVLAQGVSSGERMDYTVQKAVELGVTAIQPLMTERSIVRLDAARAARRVAHWQGVVAAACEQCGRNHVPEVASAASFHTWLGALAPGALRLALAPGGSARLGDLARPTVDIVLLAGPEGGLSPREHADAEVAGFVAVRLGPRVLRTETAALAALATMQALWGDF